MADRAITHSVCSLCMGPIRPGQPIRGTGLREAGRLAHASCVASHLQSGAEGCECGHARARHPVTEENRCSDCSCVWFHATPTRVPESIGRSRYKQPRPASAQEQPVEGERMDRQHAAATLRALLDGVDPRTGEVLPADSPLNDPQVLRALFAAVEALNERPQQKRERTGPPNAGAAWSPEDHERLLRRWDANDRNIEELAKQFGRTPLGITSRLVRYGRLEPEAIEGAIPNAPPPRADGPN